MSVQMLLDWAVLAVSLFNTISLLWLGLTVLLNGDRRALGTWITGGGMLLGAVFFTSHTFILGRGLGSMGLGKEFWWWVSWGPAVVTPLAWYGAMLWYAGFRLRRPHPHRLWLSLVVALAGAMILLAFLSNPLPAYRYVVGPAPVPTLAIRGIPVLLLVYLGYTFLCYLLPLDVLRRAEAIPQPLMAAERHRARPWLMAVSGLLLLAGIVMTWTALWALAIGPEATLANVETANAVKRFDLAVSALVALAITLLGRAIVAYAVFTGRPLPRHGFFRQWRSTVMLAAGLGVVVAGTLVIQLQPLYSLMLVTLIVIVSYALYSWRAFVEREQFMGRLRPFVASLDLYDQILAARPPDPAAPQAVFDALCRDALATQWAALVPTGALATLAGPPLVYPPGRPTPPIPPSAELAAWFPSPEVRCRPAAESGAAWAVAMWTEGGLGGVLLLGEKVNGNPYTEEEIELAQAGSERLLDTLAGAEMARLSMRLLRQRIAQVRVMEGQGRRVLHDEILPQMHTAILHLGRLRDDADAQQAMEVLTTAHRRLSDLMRDAAPATPRQLAQGGWVPALRGMVEEEFAGHFDEVSWQVPADALARADQLPASISEVVYFAGRELIRNAARHARGGEAGQRLHLTVTLEATDGLRLVVEDDGVGFDFDEETAGPSGGSGLRLHSAMLAAVGGSMEVLSRPAGGTRGVITIPPEVLETGP